MSIEDQIKQLKTQAEEDFGAAQALFKAGYFAHALFWLHLVLEKYCKALWVFRNKNMKYPYVHNLIKLLQEAGISLNNEQILFYTDMNQFQAKGRYSEELEIVKATITESLCNEYIIKAKKEISWLKEQMQ